MNQVAAANPSLAERFWGIARAMESGVSADDPVAVVRHVLAVLDALAEGQVGDAVSVNTLSFLALLRDGERRGDLCYASPEQIRGESLDERSLVFSVGVLLFERLTGRHPFGAEGNAPRRIARIRKGELGSGVNYFPNVPSALRAVLMRAMGPFPEERFATLTELRARLEQFASERAPAPSLPGTARMPASAATRATAARLAGSRAHEQGATRVVRMSTAFARDLMAANEGSGPRTRTPRGTPPPPIKTSATPTASGEIADTSADRGGGRGDDSAAMRAATTVHVPAASSARAPKAAAAPPAVPAAQIATPTGAAKAQVERAEAALAPNAEAALARALGAAPEVPVRSIDRAPVAQMVAEMIDRAPVAEMIDRAEQPDVFASEPVADLRPRRGPLATRLLWLAMGAGLAIGITALLSSRGGSASSASAASVSAASAAASSPGAAESAASSHSGDDASADRAAVRAGDSAAASPAGAPSSSAPTIEPAAPQTSITHFDPEHGGFLALSRVESCFSPAQLQAGVVFRTGLLFPPRAGGVSKVYFAADAEIGGPERVCVRRALTGLVAGAAPDKGVVINYQFTLRPSGSGYEIK